MKQLLGRLTTNRVTAALTGCVLTAVLNSSSVTTVLVVGFVSSGLMSVTQSVGVIMGANVGTTLTVQIIAFNVQESSLLFVAAGVLLQFAGQRDGWRQLGQFLLGLGLLFLGMTVIGEAAKPLRSFQPFIDFMAQMETPLFGIAVGAAFTALIQSSAATTGIVIALASSGLIGLPAGIALILGANVGTCATALLATIGKSRDALRTAVVHVLFNTIGVLAWAAFIPQLADLVIWISPAHADLAGAQRLAAELPRQMANAHAVFNVANTLILLPFSGLLARLALAIVPEAESAPESRPRHLEPAALQLPAAALRNARLEAARMAEIAHRMVRRIPEAIHARESRVLDQLQATDDSADDLQAAIIDYMSRLRKGDLSDDESAEFRRLMVAIDSLERIADTVAEDIVDICRNKQQNDLVPSDTMREMLEGLYEDVARAVEETVGMVRDDDADAAHRLIDRKPRMKAQVSEIHQHQEMRFGEADNDRLAVFRMEMDITEKLYRIYSLAKRIAHATE